MSMSRYGGSAAVRMVDAAVVASGKTVRGIASELRLTPHYLSMVRNGGAAVPASRFRDFARVLGIDPARLARACAESYADNRSWRAVAQGLDLGIGWSQPVVSETPGRRAA